MTIKDFDKYDPQFKNYSFFVSYWLKDTLKEMIRTYKPGKDDPQWVLEMKANAADIPMLKAAACTVGMNPEQVVSTMWETAKRLKLERLNKKTAEKREYRKAA